jgi:hypothetical protein
MRTIATAALLAAALGFPQEPIRISVRDGRPVAAAAMAIEKHFGRAITYEDTLYLHPSEIVDVTDKFSRSPDKSKRLFGMRPGVIEVSLVPRAATPGAQIEEVLAAVLAEHMRAGNAGEFRVENGLEVHHVVATAFKDASGATSRLAQPLDTRLTFARREQSAYEAIQSTLAAVTAASGVRVEPGTGTWGNLFFQRRVTTEARNEPARKVLWRLLQAIRSDLSWQLLCGAKDPNCAFNIYAIRPSRVPHELID